VIRKSEHLIKRGAITDELLADEATLCSVKRRRDQLENFAGPPFAVERKTLMISDRAEEPVEQKLGPREGVGETVTKKSPVNPAETGLGDEANTRGVKNLFVNLAHGTSL
jgi:hypothetical protein